MSRTIQQLAQKIPFFHLKVTNVDTVGAFGSNCFQGEAPCFVADFLKRSLFIVETHLVSGKPYVS